MKRKDLKEQLLRTRHQCEGQAFLEHECSNDIHMNEVIFTRKHIQHLKPKAKEYYWHRVNCSLVCGKFHRQHGHSKRFRAWWINHVISLYGVKEVYEFYKNAQLKIKGYNYILELFDEMKGKEND